MRYKYVCLSFILLLGFSFLIANNNNLQNTQLKEKLQDLLIEWKNRDGATGYELSTKISKVLILNDLLFFELMNDHKNEFNEWSEKLQYQTFTAYKAVDEIDRILYKAMLLKLKELMIDKVKKYLNHSIYGNMALNLKTNLDKIYIRFID